MDARAETEAAEDRGERDMRAAYDEAVTDAEALEGPHRAFARLARPDDAGAFLREALRERPHARLSRLVVEWDARDRNLTG
jgi:hypothetical protein